MPQGNLVQIRIKGLETNNSELSEVDPGSLSDCNNIVLNRESIIEPRRGFKFYGTAMGGSPSTDQARQLFQYKNRILRHFSSTLEFDDGVGNFSAFSGSYNELSPGIRIKGIEINGNFYFTTSQGVMKIGAKTASDLSVASGYITLAGGVKALGGEASLNYQTGFFEQNSKIAYRIVWGIKDRAGNLVLGSPSQRIVVENSQLKLLIKDFNALLAKLDVESAASGVDELSDTNYVDTYKINLESGLATALRTNLIGLADKLENDINLIANSAYTRTTTTASITANVATIDFSSVLPSWVAVGQTIRISGFTAVGLTVLNGDFSITSVGASSISFSVISANVAITADTGAKVINHQFNAITPIGAVENPATTTMLDDLQIFYDAIVDTIQVLVASQIANPLNFATNFSTQSSTVNLTFAVPSEATTANFYQIYRTAVAIADGPILLDDVDPGDEQGLVFESNPTSAEILAKVIEFHDITPEAFRGANLYTNQQTGEGILQANEKPPIALDINTFKGHTFYANTKTVQRLQFSLLGISDLVSGVSKLIITNGTSTQEYIFQSPQEEITTATAVADIANSLAGTYFLINSALNETEYYIWYKVSGIGADPSLSGKIGIRVDIVTSDTATAVALATRVKLNQYDDFIVTGATNQIIITNIKDGVTDSAVAGTSGFTIVITQEGDGEDASLNKIILSNKPTPAQQVDESARSIERVINKNSSSIVNAYYLSGVNDIPGLILLESRNLSDSAFYLGCNDKETTGDSFSPALQERHTISSNTIANPTIVTSTAHGLTTGTKIIIYNSDSVPVINGEKVVTNISANTFSVPVATTVAGTVGYYFLSSVSSDNEIAPNRIYYSKFQQPEAVPIVNYLDVGAKDSLILRIVPLRDSLFVFKEEGIYRISGDGGNTGFSLSLFDSSTIIVAPDSADVLNNQVFLYSDQGIVAVSDTGVTIMSAKIENLLLPLINKSNFMSNTWGISNENDRAFLIGTITYLNEEISTVIYRYNVFTSAWTKWNISKTCGLIKDTKTYLGAGDTNKIEVERKDFTRTDYADREETRTLANNAVTGTTVAINSAINVTADDVITQEQRLTVYKLNQLLKKLDDDGMVVDTNYLSILEAFPGSNLRDILTALAVKLDADAGVADTNYGSAISAYTSSFVDTQAAYNVIINKLNADTTVQFFNYPLSSGITLYESIIESVNTVTAKIVMRHEIPIIAGDVVIYNHITTEIVWNVQGFGDSEQLKQVSEAKFIFERTNFTKARIEYASDISPAFQESDFEEYGNGTFGNYAFGQSPFGGNGDRSPLRTYVPRTKQRCRLLICKLSHGVAREKMSVLGYSMLARPYSTKAYL